MKRRILLFTQINIVKLEKQLHDYFRETNGATCCRVLIKNYPDRNSLERKTICGDLGVKNEKTIKTSNNRI